MVTNLYDLLFQTIFQTFQKLATSRILSKKWKSEFYTDKTNSHDFLANQVRLVISYPSFNETLDVFQRKAPIEY